MRIGVVSDTHGLLRPEVLAAFANVDHILHAGDIGGDGIIRELRKLAPVSAVLGNNDNASGTEIKRVRLGGARILLTHILERPVRKESADIVVFGHSHLPHNERIDEVLYFNPASAGPRRFSLPVAIGMLEKKGRAWNAQHIGLDERSIGALKKTMNQLSLR